MSSTTENFLADSLASQAVFTDGDSKLPLAALRLSTTINASVFTLEQISLDSDRTPKLQAKLYADGELLLDIADFSTGSEIIIDDYIHGFVVKEDTNVFLTYVVPLSDFHVSYPGVKRLTSFCIELSGSEVEVTVNAENLTQENGLELQLQPGYNTKITPNNGIEFSAVPGAGAGYEPNLCESDSAIYITKLNGVGPNSKGDLVLNGDACITAVPTTDGAKIDAHCPPCCRCKDFKATHKFVKFIAAEYTKLAQSVCVTADLYTSTVERFTNEGCSCCAAFGAVISRFRAWPQQNFKMMAQALIQNNTKYDINLSSVAFEVKVTAKNNVSVTDENGAVYQIQAGQPLQVDVVPYSSHSYFRAKNPTPITNEVTGLNSIKAVATVDGGVACATGSASNNTMSSCSGYMMINTGFTITDPVFRKVVSLASDPIDIHLDMAVTGPGTSNCPDIANLDINGSNLQCVPIRSNKSLADQCAPATATTLEVDGSDLVIKFDKPINTSNAKVVIKVLGYGQDGQSGSYSELTTQEVTIPDSVSPNMTIRIPKPNYQPGASTIVVYEVSAGANSGVGIKCGTNNVDVGVESIKVATAVTL